MMFWLLLSLVFTVNAYKPIQNQVPNDPSVYINVLNTLRDALDQSFWTTVELMKSNLKALNVTVDPDNVDDWTKCALGFGDIIESFTTNRDGSNLMSAIAMIDSGTKLPSGILQGHIVDIGQFDECVEVERSNVQVKIPGTEANFVTSYTGHHCMIGFTIPSIPLTIQLAKCYPSTCKEDMVTTIWEILLTQPNKYLKNTFNATIIPSAVCTTKDLPPLDGLDWAMIFIVCLFVLIGVICTLVDRFHLRKELINRQPTSTEQIVRAFSIEANATKLFSTAQSAEQMNCINGLKFFSICWVVLGHRYIYVGVVPLMNAIVVLQATSKWDKMIIYNGILSVDTFFVISGLLNMYTFLNLMAKGATYNLVTVFFGYLHRYLRLTPAYLMMMGLTATLIYRTGNGPLWESVVGLEKDNCRSNWWIGLLYLQNYVDPPHNCLSQSWYLAADMQMFWLSPFVIYPLYRWPKFGFVNLAVLIAASIASPFAVSYTNNIPAPLPTTNDPDRSLFELDVLYKPMHTKTVSYLIGILFGYIVQKIKVGKLKFELNMVKSTIGWVLATASMLYALFGCYPLFQPDHPGQLLTSLYLSFYRVLWSVGVSWVIFACISGYGGIANWILSLKPFGPLGRLAYCIYLCHIFVIVHKVGTTRTSWYFTDYDLVLTYLGELTISIAFATCLSLLLESPMMGIEKLLFGGRGGIQNKRTNQSRPSDQEAPQPREHYN